MALLLVGALPLRVDADVVISFNGGTTENRGTGFGSVLHILGLHHDDIESGSVTRIGSGDVRTGDAVNTSDTVSVQDLFNVGVTQSDNGLDLVFGIDEAGTGPLATEVTIDQLTLFFTDATGQTIQGLDAMASFTGVPLTLAQIAGGVGKAGWIFDVTFTPAQWFLFTGNVNNRIGMSATISGTSNGPEDFYVAPASATVPEPSTTFLLSLLGGLGFVANSLRRRSRPGGPIAQYRRVRTLRSHLQARSLVRQAVG